MPLDDYVCYSSVAGKMHLASLVIDEQLEFSICGRVTAEMTHEGDFDPDNCDGLCTWCLSGYLNAEKLILTKIVCVPKR